MEDTNLKLTDKEIAAAFSSGNWAERFPPILTLDQASDLLGIPRDTLYGWRSRGALNGCCRKVGKHLRFFRDRLIKHVFNEGIVSK